MGAVKMGYSHSHPVWNKWINSARAEECPDCRGHGMVEQDVPRQHGFDRDIGYISTVEVQCDVCDGSGSIEREDEDA
jgi:DnaJ-class molecular chaperone